MKLFPALSVVLVASAAQAASLKIDCAFTDPEIRDRVQVELTSDQRGTFNYIESGETPEATDARLDLMRVASDRADTAKFRVNREEVGLYYLMPGNLVAKPSESFAGSLVTVIPELNLTHNQELKCSSRN